jgi:uncharacterized RDD family membrane protein YckC
VSLAAEPPGGRRISPARAQAVAERVHGAPAAPPVEYEGLVTRTIAFAVDAAIVNLVAALVSVTVGLAASLFDFPDTIKTIVIAIGGVAYLAWTVGYFVVFWSTTGQTPGSRLIRLRVCDADTGRPIRPGRALVRLVVLMISVIPLFAGLWPILVDDRRRGLHDMVAGTVVVGAEPAESGAQAGKPGRVPY